MIPPVDLDPLRPDAEARRKLAQAQVLVIGAGALGAAVLPALAAAGVGTVSIIDDRTVEAGEQHTLGAASHVGRPKVDSAADALVRLSPGITVIRHVARFVEAGSFELLLDADLLVDASGDVGTHYLANDAAAIRGIPMVWGSVSRRGGQVGVAWDERGVDYRDLFPVQQPEPEHEHEAPEGDATDGVPVEGLPPVRTVIGGMMATEAIKLLTGVGEPLLGRVVSYDALSGTTRITRHRRDPDAARPGSLEERTALREPDPERSITPARLRQLLAGPTTAGIHETPPILLDVREAPEASFVSLPGSLLIPLGQLPDRLDELGALTDGGHASIVVYCHHGVRSARALDVLEKAGFTRVRHLTGGIDAWAVQVEPGMPRY